MEKVIKQAPRPLPRAADPESRRGNFVPVVKQLGASPTEEALMGKAGQVERGGVARKIEPYKGESGGALKKEPNDV